MTSVGYVSTWEAHSSCTSDRRTTILPQVTLPMAFVNITSPLFTRPQLDDDELEQREYMMAQIKGIEEDVTDKRPKNIKYVALRFKGLPAHVAKNFNLPAHYEYPPPITRNWSSTFISTKLILFPFNSRIQTIVW